MFNQLEEKLVELDGIISCKVTGEEEIDEIHVVASKARDPKRIVRDIETVVLIENDYEVDHKKISIARINDVNREQRKNRIEIISIYMENNRPVCHIKLKINDEMVEEKVEGGIEEPIRYIVAEGMVDILQKYTSYKGKIRIENIFTTGINHEIILVQVLLINKKGEQERLVGAAYINHNLPLATGKACLKALNRRLNLLA